MTFDMDQEEEIVRDEPEIAHDFSQLLEDYESERPRRGQIIEGEVVHLDEDMVLVDVGAKRDAFVQPSELRDLDESLLDGLELGDTIPVYVTETPRLNNHLVVSIDKGLQHEDWQKAKTHLQTQETVELPVVGKNRGGLLVDFGRLQGFVPNSHLLDIRRSADKNLAETAKDEKIGSHLLLKIIEVEPDRNRLILSEREAQEERQLQRLEELEVGQILEGRVVNLVKFGAFVNLDGIDGLIHISELSWDHVDRPEEVLQMGDEVQVIVKSVDADRQRVSLSRKALLPSPWDSLQDRYSVGDLVEGSVTSVRDFGAFVRLGAGVEGLIHRSEIPLPPDSEPQEALKPGDPVLTRIIELDLQRQRIGLSLQKVDEEESLGWMMENWQTEPNSPEPAAAEGESAELAPTDDPDGEPGGPNPAEDA